MPGLMMATSPKTPTARKAPVLSSPTSKGSPVKPKQQRKTSNAQGPPKTQQQRKNSNAKSSPKVVIAKKNNSIVAPKQQRKDSEVKDESMAGEKRKVKTEVVEPTSAGSGDVLVALMVPVQKKAKVELEMKSVVSTQAVTGPQTPTPSQSPKPSNLPPIAPMINQLLTIVLQGQPTLLPPPGNPILSSHIDAIAHAMWQLAFHQGPMLQTACKYSALFAPLKMAALAKLNYLPSWWFYREMAVRQLVARVEEARKKDKDTEVAEGKGTGEGGEGNNAEDVKEKGWTVVDDGEMDKLWRDTIDWAVRYNRPRIEMGGWGPEGRRALTKLAEKKEEDKAEGEERDEGDMGETVDEGAEKMLE